MRSSPESNNNNCNHSLPLTTSTSSLESLQQHPLLDCKLAGKLPIIYRREHDITAWGLERFHPFDSAKYGKIVKHLIASKHLKSRDELVRTKRVSGDILRKGHTQKYLDSLRSGATVARICEFPLMASVPYCILHRKMLRPMQYHVGGSIFAAEAALHYGWSINLGGGMHHASADTAGGWCVYADITMALSALFEAGKIQRAMIIDLDVHQGNGFERDLLEGRMCKSSDSVYIVDAFNEHIYPHDSVAKKAISLKVPFKSRTEDAEYLLRIEEALDEAFDQFPNPDIVVYNAGTDILKGDPLGEFSVSAQGVKKRDEMVFENCIQRGIPVAMLTSGGYAPNSASVIADSIENLFDTVNLREVASRRIRKCEGRTSDSRI